MNLPNPSFIFSNKDFFPPLSSSFFCFSSFGFATVLVPVALLVIVEGKPNTLESALEFCCINGLISSPELPFG